MTRTVIVLGIAALAASTAAFPARSRIDLDQPGALQTLARENPQHFERAAGILRLASDMPCQMDEFAKVSKVRFMAAGAGCGALLFTSYPAKRRLSFTLDDTEYVSVVTMKAEEKLVPAK